MIMKENEIYLSTLIRSLEKIIIIQILKNQTNKHTHTHKTTQKNKNVNLFGQNRR